MQFHAKSVEASVSGDYYQLSFCSEEDQDELQDAEELGEYVLLQRQFEFEDNGKCYIESNDENHIGHFHVRLIELTANRLVFKLRRPSNNHVEISYSLADSEFAVFRTIAEIMFGLREPQIDDTDSIC